MSDKKPTIDNVRRDAGSAMLRCLNECKFNEITYDMIASEAKHSAALIRRLFPTMTQMVDQGLRDLDDDLMAGFAEDLAEDVDAETRERILEGLIVRYEAYSPFKDAIKNLNMAALTNPTLASLTIHRLSAVSKTILELSGDDTSGVKGLLRVKGLAGVALAAQRDWFADDTADMSVTIRVLDERLKQAESFAISLNIIPAHPKADEA